MKTANRPSVQAVVRRCCAFCRHWEGREWNELARCRIHLRKTRHTYTCGTYEQNVKAEAQQ